MCEYNSQSDNALENHLSQSFALSPTYESVFHSQTRFLEPHAPLQCTFSFELNVQVVTIELTLICSRP